jgi:serine phosphatase RsbU (regulator of sigma subunit)
MLPSVNRQRVRVPELRSLLGHSESVGADAPLEQVHRRFSENGRDFIAVLDGTRLLGVCARREIAMQLGARFGFALFAQNPVSKHLMDAALALRETTPLTEALESVAARANHNFYDDVLLVDEEGNFLGFIFVHALVRLQTELLLGNIEALEQSRQEVAEKNRAMEEDVLMAREVQLAMLPAEEDYADPQSRWQFCSHYRPAGGVSGDFLQLIRISDDAAGILLCDVMGHGVRAALVTAMLRAFADDLRPAASDPGALLTQLNRCLLGILRRSGNLLFVTAAYAVIDTASSTLAYGQAGHPTGFFRHASGKVELLPTEGDVAGPALGLIDDIQYISASRSIHAGDSVVLFTDGLSEARNAAGEEWGPERLRGEIECNGTLKGCDLLPSVVAAAGRFAGRDAFEDDVCIVFLGARP